MGYMTPLIAAAAKKREREQEREELAMIKRLAEEDGEGRYEYKILRSYSNTFRSPTRRQQILNEEARAGWEMVAKLDNARLVMRRPRSAGDSPARGIDPYRTEVDTNLPLVIGALLALILLVGMVTMAVFLGNDSSGESDWTILAVIGLVALIAVGAAVRAKARSSR
jgi:hypothetical protein